MSNTLSTYSETNRNLWKFSFASKASIFLLISTSFFLFGIAPSAHAGLIFKAPSSIGLISGLVGYWSFDGKDMAGVTAYDRSGQGNNGTLTNGPARAIGKIGQGLNFDGSNDYVNIPSATPLVMTNADVSLSFWLKTSVSPQSALLGKAYNTVYAYGLDFSGSGGAYRMKIRNSVTDVDYETGIAPTLNTWEFIVAVFDDTGSDVTLTFYKNGASGFTQTGAIRIGDNGGAFYLGARDAPPSDYYNGLIDDVRVYNRALNENEIKRLYKIGGTLKLGNSKAQNTGSLTRGLVGYWSFDESTHGTTSVADLSGNNNRGHLINGPARAIGKIGQGLNFDGNNDLVDAPTSSSFDTLTGQITISAWIKRNTANNDDGIVNRYNATNAQRSWTLYIDTDNKIKWSVQENQGSFNSAQVHASTATLATATWYHVVVTFVPNTQKQIYINGSLDSTHTTNIASDLEIPAISVEIGHNDHLASDYYFNGQIDDVRIYNRALSADEIKRLYKIGGTLKLGDSKSLNTNSLTSGLVGYWSFDESTHGTTSVADLSGNNNRGHLINGPQKAIGKIGQGLNFDGSDDYVNLGSNLSILQNVSGATFSAWIKADSLTGVEHRTILFVSRNGATNSSRVEMRFQNDTGFLVLRAKSADADATQVVTYGTLLNTGRWYHLAGTVHFGSNTMKIYVDGVEVPTTGTPSFSQSTTANTTSDIATVGTAGTSPDFFDGIIDDVRVYNRALSPDEIKRLYNIGR